MKYKFCFYLQIVDLSDIELESPQLENQSDHDYVPSTDGEFETPVKKRKKKSSLAPTLTRKTTQSSLFVSTNFVLIHRDII